MRFIYIYNHPDRYAITWGLLKERPTYANISHTGWLPEFGDHMKYIDGKPHPIYFFIAAGYPERIVGTIYLSAQREIGIAIMAEEQRKGYGRLAIQKLRAMYPGKMFANIAPGNEISRRMFAELGGHTVQITMRLP